MVVVGRGSVFIVDTKAWRDVAVHGDRITRAQEDITDDGDRFADLAHASVAALSLTHARARTRCTRQRRSRPSASCTPHAARRRRIGRRPRRARCHRSRYKRYPAIGVPRRDVLARATGQRVLFATDIATLTKVLESLLARLAAGMVGRVEFVGVHKFAKDRLDERGIPFRAPGPKARLASDDAWTVIRAFNPLRSARFTRRY